MTLSVWIDLCVNPQNKLWLSNINAIRSATDDSMKRKLKQLLPAITPSAELWTREADVPSDKKIKSHSGFMQFDIDLKDNPSITDAAQLRDTISLNPYIAVCMLSASGKGIWGLVKVACLDYFHEHYEQLKRDFQGIGIMIDPSKGGNPCDLRFYTYDPDAYVAESYTVYERVHIESKPAVHSPTNGTGDIYGMVYALIQQVVARQINIAPEYPSYLRLGFAFAHEFGESGRDLFHQACSPSPKYNRVEADKQYTICLKQDRGTITIGTFFHLWEQLGL